MLQGMAPALAATVKDDTHTKVLLYTPAVRDTDFVVAISYLFRRLEENAADDNFMRHVFGLTPGSDAFAEQERIFRDSLAMRNDVSLRPPTHATTSRTDNAAICSGRAVPQRTRHRPDALVEP